LSLLLSSAAYAGAVSIAPLSAPKKGETDKPRS